MLVRRVADVVGTEKEVHCPTPEICKSLRVLLAADGVGFSVNKTIVYRGDEQYWHYKYHVEACYCVSGLARLTNVSTGEEHWVEPDTLYVLDKHDPHKFKALKDTVLISIFNPPLVGNEVHRADGSYPVLRSKE